ncbi:glycolipid transfer protein [Daedaleopsis nitida]|nr:glycolipid transfer protein [Daedaleopsis nitida]
MAPYFETAKSFADVPITDEGVDTATFLLASTDFVNMFDLLGGGVFAFVQNDLRGNIAGVRQRYEAAAADSPTLEKLVRNECEGRERAGTASLVRLVRGLWFTCEALRNMQEDRNAELHVCFKRSFDAILRHRLPFIARPVVAVAIRAVPHRQEFYARITQGGSHERFDNELTKWLAGLEGIIHRLRGFLTDGRYGTV